MPSKPARGESVGAFRLWGQMSRLRTGQTEFALEVVPGNVDVRHRHPWMFVTEKFHERGYGEARTNHLTCIGVSELVRNDAGGDAGRRTDFVQVVAQLADQGGLAVGTGEQVAVGRQGVERAEEA